MVKKTKQYYDPTLVFLYLCLFIHHMFTLENFFSRRIIGDSTFHLFRYIFNKISRVVTFGGYIVKRSVWFAKKCQQKLNSKSKNWTIFIFISTVILKLKSLNILKSFFITTSLALLLAGTDMKLSSLDSPWLSM